MHTTTTVPARTSTLTDGLVAVPSYPDSVVASDGSVDLTYADMDRWSNRLARMLLRLGAGQGSLVALAAVPEFEVVAVRHALAKIGAVALSVNGEVFASAATLGVTVQARRSRLTDAVHWLVLDERATLQQYMSTSSEPLTAGELASHRRAG